MLRAWLEAALALILPQRCPLCRQWDEGRDWCLTCLAKTAKARHIALQLHKLRWLDDLVAVTNYTGITQRLIRDMKFRQMTRQAGKLGQLLDFAVLPDYYAGVEAVVPVPLHADRHRERGFNQTTLIFKPWTDRQKLNWREALTRTRPTLPQWELTLKERRANIKGAFQVTRPEWVKEKYILLVDDIFTSGLTMDECAHMLKKAGAKKVLGLALASGAM